MFPRLYRWHVYLLSYTFCSTVLFGGYRIFQHLESRYASLRQQLLAGFTEPEFQDWTAAFVQLRDVKDINKKHSNPQNRQTEQENPIAHSGKLWYLKLSKLLFYLFGGCGIFGVFLRQVAGHSCQHRLLTADMWIMWMCRSQDDVNLGPWHSWYWRIRITMSFQSLWE